MGLNILCVLIGIVLGVGLAFVLSKDRTNPVTKAVKDDDSENSVISFLRQVVKYTDDGNAADNLRDIYLLSLKNVSRDLLSETEKQSFDSLSDFLQELSLEEFNRYIEVTLNDTEVAGDNCTEGVS